MTTLMNLRLRTLLAVPAALLGLAAAGAAPMLAVDYEVSELVYANNGAYKARFYVRYDLDNRHCHMKMQDQTFTDNAPINMISNKVTVDLTKADEFLASGKNHTADSKGYCEGKAIPEGTEVWGVVKIVSGDTESCKKDFNLLYAPNGGWIKYKTKGTTLNNNRCQVETLP